MGKCMPHRQVVGPFLFPMLYFKQKFTVISRFYLFKINPLLHTSLMKKLSNCNEISCLFLNKTSALCCFLDTEFHYAPGVTCVPTSP